MNQIIKYYNKCIRGYKIALWISVTGFIVLSGLSVFNAMVGQLGALIICVILSVFPFLQIISNQKNIDYYERTKALTLSIKSKIEDLGEQLVEKRTNETDDGEE